MDARLSKSFQELKKKYSRDKEDSEEATQLSPLKHRESAEVRRLEQQLQQSKQKEQEQRAQMQNIGESLSSLVELEGDSFFKRQVQQICKLLNTSQHKLKIRKKKSLSYDASSNSQGERIFEIGSSQKVESYQGTFRSFDEFDFSQEDQSSPFSRSDISEEERSKVARTQGRNQLKLKSLRDGKRHGVKNIQNSANWRNHLPLSSFGRPSGPDSLVSESNEFYAFKAEKTQAFKKIYFDLTHNPDSYSKKQLAKKLKDKIEALDLIEKEAELKLIRLQHMERLILEKATQRRVQPDKLDSEISSSTAAAATTAKSELAESNPIDSSHKPITIVTSNRHLEGNFSFSLQESQACSPTHVLGAEIFGVTPQKQSGGHEKYRELNLRPIEDEEESHSQFPIHSRVDELTYREQALEEKEKKLVRLQTQLRAKAKQKKVDLEEMFKRKEEEMNQRRTSLKEKEEKVREKLRIYKQAQEEHQRRENQILKQEDLLEKLQTTILEAEQLYNFKFNPPHPSVIAAIEKNNENQEILRKYSKKLKNVRGFERKCKEYVKHKLKSFESKMVCRDLAHQILYASLVKIEKRGKEFKYIKRKKKRSLQNAENELAGGALIIEEEEEESSSMYSSAYKSPRKSDAELNLERREALVKQREENMDLQRDELLKNFNNLSVQVAEIKKLQESLKQQENELQRRQLAIVEKEKQFVDKESLRVMEKDIREREEILHQKEELVSKREELLKKQSIQVSGE